MIYAKLQHYETTFQLQPASNDDGYDYVLVRWVVVR